MICMAEARPQSWFNTRTEERRQSRTTTTAPTTPTAAPATSTTTTAAATTTTANATTTTAATTTTTATATTTTAATTTPTDQPIVTLPSFQNQNKDLHLEKENPFSTLTDEEVCFLLGETVKGEKILDKEEKKRGVEEKLDKTKKQKKAQEIENGRQELLRRLQEKLSGELQVFVWPVTIVVLTLMVLISSCLMMCFCQRPVHLCGFPCLDCSHESATHYMQNKERKISRAWESGTISRRKPPEADTEINLDPQPQDN